MNLFARAWASASAGDQREAENATDRAASREALAANDYRLAGHHMRCIQTCNRLAGIAERTDYARQLNAARARYG